MDSEARIHERLTELESQVDDAITRSLAALEELAELFSLEDAFRRTLADLSGTEPEFPAGRDERLFTLRRRLRGFISSSRPPLAETRHRDGHLSLFSGPLRRSKPRAREDSFAESAIDIAERIARENGQVRVREVVEALLEQEPSRYAHQRSAYGSVYQRLDASVRFRRAGPGAFALDSESGDEGAPADLA